MISLPFVRPVRRKEESSLQDPSVCEDVHILVPCHHEGDAIVRTVESLREQDYAGHITVSILMKDAGDSSCQALGEQYDCTLSDPNEGVLFSSENRVLQYVFCGVGPKREKLNSVLPTVKSTYTAFLDADHRAESAWIRTSIQQLQGSSHSGIQSKRAPLSLKRFPQVWDSAQNHIGNELVNETLNSVVGSVFFTGTTAVFRSEALQGKEFGDCVTEDTYLSYELISEGHTIDYNAEAGSREEVAPDLHSYIARRRRWSCGHNKTFFHLFSSVFRSSCNWRIKTACLIHGMFYTVPVAVCLLLNAMALHLFVQYTQAIQLLVFLTSLTIASAITLFMYGKHKSVFREIVVLLLLVFPQVSLLFPFPLYYAEHEIVYFLSMFPYMEYFLWLEVFCLLSPLCLLIFGARRMQVLLPHQLVQILFSYPFIIFFDLWSCLLGFSDFLFGRPTWSKIQRTQEEDVYEEDIHSRSWWILARGFAVCCTGVFVLLSINDLTADSNCGAPDGFLMNPQVFVPSSELEWNVSKTVALQDNHELQVSFDSHFSKGLHEDVKIVHHIDDHSLATTSGDVSNKHRVEFLTTAGWQPHIYRASLRSGDVICKREIPFTTVVKEFKENKLFINGEEFLVKGVIPSFSPHTENVDLTSGFAQIKALGANTVRYYHALTDAVRKEAKRIQLLVVDQPDKSTWRDVSLGFLFSRNMLKRRFESLVKENLNFPYVLIHVLGNELEINNPRAYLPRLTELIEEIAKEHPTWVFSYATYYVYLRLPTSIYSINMLDSGKTYWEKGIRQLKGLGQPFLATEFGGFVAFKEWTPELIRQYRLRRYWEILLREGALGAIIHQSHDNWAQPIVFGVNDPLSPDQPDDLRGIWTPQNEAKPIVSIIQDLFSDIELSVVDPLVLEDQKRLSVRIKNKRPYTLESISLSLDDATLLEGLTLAPHQEIERVLEFPRVAEKLSIHASFRSHQGLAGEAAAVLHVPVQGDRPVVLNADAFEVTYNKGTLEGKLLESSELSLVLPRDWMTVDINGKEISAKGSRVKVPLRKAMEDTVSLESSSDAKIWKAIQASDLPKGPQRVRFKLAREYPDDALLILAGLGTERYWIKAGDQEWIEKSAHNYRENFVDLASLQATAGDYIYLLLPRHKTGFLTQLLSPRGEAVDIDFEQPRVFSPPRFTVSQSS